VDIVCADFAKAFDSVVHRRLLFKLSNFGIAGNILAWIGDFLSERLQSVYVGNAVSSLRPVMSGVPQGSVLGPLLFVLYISDLNLVDTTVRLPKFADDVNLYNTIVSSADYRSLCNALRFLGDWSHKWQLPLNTKKCHTFHLGTKNEHLSYSINGTSLGSVAEFKNLGIWFTSDFKFSTHCCKIVHRAKRMAYLLRRCFVSGDVRTLTWAFQVYVRPIVEYASPVWSPYLLKDIRAVESVQRAFTRSLPGMSGLSYQQRLSSLGIQSLELRRLRADLCLTFRILHGLVDTDPSEFFVVRGNTLTRGHPLKLAVAVMRRDCTKFFFVNRVVTPWNSLPSGLVRSESIAAFKTGLKKIDLSGFLRGL
jgi:ribonuclease P/MRP protein subunit RPP40